MNDEFDVVKYFPRIKESSEGFSAPCPWCGNSDWTFKWNLEKNVGCCFHSSCSVYYQRGGVTLRRLRAFFSDAGIQENTPEVIQVSAAADLKLPDEFKPISDLEHSLSETLFSYFESRGISKKLVRRAHLGYCPTGKFWGYIVMPIFENGEVVYWQARRFKDRTPKFYNPASSVKGDLIYRIGKCPKPKRIILVESVFNVLTLYRKSSSDLVIGLLGKTVTQTQLDKILVYERWVREVVVALDTGDALKDAIDVAFKFSRSVPRVSIPIFPEGEDVNSLGRERAWQFIADAKPYRERDRIKMGKKKMRTTAGWDFRP